MSNDYAFIHINQIGQSNPLAGRVFSAMSKYPKNRTASNTILLIATLCLKLFFTDLNFS